MWRDAAVILLAIETMLLGLLSAMAVYWSLQAVGRLLKWIRPVLFEARMYAWRIREGTGRIMNALAAPFIWLQSTMVGLRRALERLGWK
jgi:hypothetical protein